MPEKLDDVPPRRLEKGQHTEVETPHRLIDDCVQIWPDTDFAELHRHGCTA